MKITYSQDDTQKDRMGRTMNDIGKLIDAIGIDHERRNQIALKMSNILDEQFKEFHTNLTTEKKKVIDLADTQRLLNASLSKMIDFSLENYHDRTETMYAGILIGETLSAAVIAGVYSNIDINLLLERD